MLPVVAQADGDAEAYRLLKSWGMQFNADGRLYFHASAESEPTVESSWNPDVSSYETNPPEHTQHPLQPVIISSRQPAKQ